MEEADALADDIIIMVSGSVSEGGREGGRCSDAE
jgi:hypothetical protein